MRRFGPYALFCVLLLAAALAPVLVGAAPRNGLKVVYDTPTDPAHLEIQKILKKKGVFEAICKTLNEGFDIPVPMVVRFTACDEENAYYDPETHEISMCYELIEKYRHIYDEDVTTREEMEAEVFNAALFTFFHELGHGMVDVLELPITGKEEDAVDEFAAILLLDYCGEVGQDAILAAADQFAVDAEENEEEVQEIDDLPYWDTHSLDKVRLYDLLCVIYGSDPEAHADLVEEEVLPEDRASGCEEEYQRKSAVWDQLLAPHLKG